MATWQELLNAITLRVTTGDGKIYTPLWTDAQKKLFEVIETLDNYVKMSGDTNAKTLIVNHLKIMASREHGFMSHDLNMDDLFDRVMGDQNEE